ncbi:MAG: DEAD/DEAH box helicase, partial [Thermoanaerobaculia bacterium]
LTGAWEGGALRVLYVSPLKALNSDIERNLRAPLLELRRELAAAAADAAAVHVAVRSGDTPQSERARMLRRAPEILITTPESLNLLLLSARAGNLFGGLRTVILDEIHAVASDKRGTHLITAVERLVRHAGEFQRVAMSATVRPAERVARFVGGWRPARGAGGEVHHEPRPVAVLAAPSAKRYELSVRFPFPPAGEGEEPREGDAFWRRLADDLRARIGECRSTIVFTNSRRLAEKTTRFVNEAAGHELAWSHHGSLARDLRRAVEERLKAGSLPAIVATSSLELGIDVGALDRVLLLQSPRSLASATQRVGRAGHGVGEVSRAIFYPTHARDFLDCAVAVAGVRAGEIEPARPVRAPLDLLAQTVLACVARERWKLDDLYDFLRAADPFHDLSRVQFDLVAEMLAGRYADARVEELRPRVAIDRIAGTIEGRPGLARLLARAGGTIPDRGHFQIRIEGSNAKLGELDEEFVWERSVGDGFVLGAQSWRVRAITSNEVVVAPARGGAMLAPFWRADARDRGACFSAKVAELLESADARLGDPAFTDELTAAHDLEPAAAAELVRVLREERAVLGVALPHRRHLVIEETAGRAGEAPERREVVLFTFWGGTVNRPLALALGALWEEREGVPLETLADDDAVLLVLPPGADARELLGALEPERCEELLRARLESSGFFGAHFRQNAQRALLLPRALPGRRTPLWVSRQNAKRLLEAVARHDDFPIVLETWRTCLADEFELEVLRERLRELAAGEIRVSSVRTSRPSPFAAGLVRQRTNELMYDDDAPEPRRSSTLRGDLLREIALDAAGRPAIPATLVERFAAKAQRLLPGYAPGDPGELLEWVKERLIVPLDEWRALLAAIERDRVASAGAPSADDLVAAVATKLVRWRPSPSLEAVSALETALRLGGVPELAAAFATTATPLGAGVILDANPHELVARASTATQPAEKGSVTRPRDGTTPPLATIVGQLLPFYGVLSSRRLEQLTGAAAGEMEAALGELLRTERAVAGELVEGAGERGFAARSTFETLLRWKRAEARPELRPLPLERLPAWVAWRQGLLERGSGPEGLERALERLFGVTLPAGLWEREVLPARLESYQPAWLDALFEDSELVWTGGGLERAAFLFRGDLDLLAPEAGPGGASPGDLDALERRVLEALRAVPRGLDLAALSEVTIATSAALTETLWSLAWRGVVAC